MNIASIIPEQLATLIGARTDKTEYGPIGIDFGRQGVRLVQFRKKQKTIQLSNSLYVPFPSDLDTGSVKALSALIRHAIRYSTFKGQDATTSLRDSDTRIFMLNYLLTADRDDESIIAQRMQERLDGDISQYVIDYMLVRPEGGVAHERSALVAVAKTEKVIHHLETLRKAGLNVTALEIEPMAIRRLISVRHLDEGIANLLSISIGKRQTYLTVLSGRRLIYEREIEFGEQSIIERICDVLDINNNEAMSLLKLPDSPVEQNIDPNLSIRLDELKLVLKPIFKDLVEDINKALIYAASETRGLEVKKIYLTGAISRWACVISSIQSMVEVNTGVLMPLDGMAGGEHFENDTRNTVATGLALRGLTEVA